ncbi:MAG: DNA (cytosine-5-)-methyltransferase [Ardenticatenaceae bacterium]|nr:DNA (cytosine-5-)-methyltransferase [Ardenticatenaceae bacterium]
MQRKDGKPKRKALRSMPRFQHGFRNNPSTNLYRRSLWSGVHTDQNYSVVSLFSGCGGLDLGFAGGFTFLDKQYNALPFDIVHAVDNSEDAVTTYQLNLGDHIHLGDLTTLAVGKIPQATILMGGFPCQDFSSSGSKAGFAGKRGQLYQVLAEYMAYHQPEIVVGENVPHLARLNGGVYLDTILRDFEREGYRFDVWDLFAPDYGLPQSRRRLFLIGVRKDLAGYPVKPKPTHKYAHVSIAEGLHDLENIIDETVANQSQYFVSTRATSGGGQGDHTNDAEKVAYCIRANARGRIQFHYKLPRRLTVRECARLQSFPDEFVFPFSTQRNLTLIGNAVPPILGYHVATSIRDFLDAKSKNASPELPEIHQIEEKGVTRERVRPIQLSLFAKIPKIIEPIK